MKKVYITITVTYIIVMSVNYRIMLTKKIDFLTIIIVVDILLVADHL